MNRVFIVAGEVSGDLVGAWFVRNKIDQVIRGPIAAVEGVGGDALAQAGMKIRYSYAELNLVGLFEILKKLPAVFRFMRELVDVIIAGNFNHVILIDFAGFNLRLAQRLKRRNPSLKIIYLAPPQLWCWAEWRLKTLRAGSDELVVLFPFEVEWYRQRGMTVHYLGNPVYDRLHDAMAHDVKPVFRLGIFPGSRMQELERFVPLLCEVLRELVKKIPSLEIAAFVAPHIDQKFLEPLLAAAPGRVVLVSPQDRVAMMQSCALALTKGGTVTLELGLLRVPTVIFYTTNWLTYVAAKVLVSINRMGLPNIIAKKDLMPEFIQSNCTPQNLVQAVSEVLELWQKNNVAYDQQREKFNYLVQLFSQTL
jgi:lipid-A-disaccharide synthase